MVPARCLALALCVLLPASLAAAQNPDQSAWELLEQADSFYSGSGGRVDEREARSLFEKAEATGDPVARLRVAALRHLGRCGFDKDPARAAGLAVPVLDAVRGVAKDRRLALDWYRKAADAGDSISVYRIGQAHFKGEGVPADPRQGILHYEKSAAMGFVSAAHDLARIYENGWHGVPKDVEKARVHYRRAAELGSEEAAGWLKHEKQSGRESWP